MTKVPTARRRAVILLSAAAPVALLLGLAAPAQAQVVTGGGNTAAGAVLNSVTQSGAGPSFGGAASNTGAADTSTITLNASRTILNWNGFNLAPNDTLQFSFGAANHVVLNRVNGGTGTIINGTVSGNGNVWFMDSAGIAVGGTAAINVGGLLLSTLSLTDADFLDGNANFQFSGSGGSTTVNGGAVLDAANGAVTILSPGIDFSGSATASGSIALVAARDAQIVFDSDLDAYLALTVNTGSDQNTAISAGSQARFDAAAAASGGKTYLIGAGNGAALGSILLGGSAADAVEFVDGDVVLYAAGTISSSQSLISGGAFQGLNASASGGADVTIGAATVAGGSLNAIAVDDVIVSDQLTISAGNVRLEAGSDLTVDVAVSVNGDYTIRADDWTGAGVFNPLEGNDVIIEDTAFGLSIGGRSAARHLRISTQGGDLNIVGGALTAGGEIHLSASNGPGGTLSVGDSLTATADLVSLTSSGSISQSGGILTAGTLAVSATGAVGLTRNNAIDVLAASSANGLTLADTGGLTVTGAVSSGAGGVSLTTSGDLTLSAATTSANGPISLTATGVNADIVLNGAANAGTGTVTLTANGAGGTISQNASGIITAGTLTGSSSGVTTLTAATNAIAALGAFSTAGLSIVDAAGLTVSGALSGGAGGVSLTTGGDLTVEAGVSSSNAAVSLTATGAGSDIVLDGAIAAGLGTVTLTAAGTGGTITQTSSGAITANVLTGASDGATTLTASNQLTALGAFSANGFSLTEVNGLTVSGAVSGGAAGIEIGANGALTVNGALTAVNGPISLSDASADITLTSAINAGTGTVTLNAGGQIDQTAGGVTAGLLAATAGGALDLGAVAANNDVAQLGPVSAGGAFDFRNVDGFSVSGALSSGAGLTLIAESGALGLGADVSGQTVSLNVSSGALTQSAGVITADTLTGFVSLAATLDQTNQINNLGGFVANSLSLADAGGLTVTGAVGPGAGGGDVSLRTSGGPLTIGAAAQVRGGNIVLSTDGDFVNQSGSDALLTNGKWTVYAASPDTSAFDNLNSGATAIWNGTLATRAPGSVTGNRYVFAYQPTLTVTTLGTSKVYGTDLTASAGSLYAVSGYHAGVTGAFLGDSAATAFSGAPVISSGGLAERASVADGPYAVTAALGSLASGSGYAFTVSNVGQITVTAKALTANVTAANKTYDATTAGSGSVSLGGVLSGDAVSTAGGTWTFADRNAGTGKTVTISGVTLTGADAGNYSVTIPATTLADILQRAITANVAASNKIYDGTTTAGGSVTLSGVLGSDAVAATGGTFAFADRNAGTGKTVSVSGVSLTGADAGNYTLSVPATTIADILQRAITADLTAASKIYDGTTPGSGSVGLNGVLGSDAVGATAGTWTFADRNAGAGKTVTVSGVTLTGADAGNYTVTIPASTVADILQRAITGSLAASNRTYDGTTVGSGSIGLNGVLGGDSVGTTAGTWTFADRNAGAGKMVTVTGVALTGADAGNYSLAIPASTLADILQRTITATVTAADKTYDGTTAGSGGVSLAGVLAGDDVATTAGTFTFADGNAGIGKTVDVTGLGLTGADAGNYTVVLPASTTATILQRAITANVSAANRTYDGTTSAVGAVTLNGVLGGDSVGTTAGTFAFADPNAGAGKTVTVSGVALTGPQAGNYSVTVPASTLASILRRAITVSADAASKAEGQADPALTYAITSGGLVAGDTLSGSLARAPGEAVGEYAITQGALAASANYELSFVGNTLTITAVPFSPDTQAATVQEIQDLVAFLALYDGLDANGGSLVVADERDACESGQGADRGSCAAGSAGGDR